MSSKPQMVKLHPSELNEEIRHPVLLALVDKGWRVGPAIILEDPRAPEHDRVRIGLLMIPPIAETVVDAKPDPIARVAALISAVALVALVLAEIALRW